MCGVVWQDRAGAHGFEIGKNMSTSSQECSFEIPPKAILEWSQQASREDKTLLAWVHSHPGGKPEASLVDRNFWWAGDDWLWPGMDQAILWPDETQVLKLSVYGPGTAKNGPSPRWQGSLNV